MNRSRFLEKGRHQRHTGVSRNLSFYNEIYIGATCKSIRYNSFENCRESASIYLSDTYESFDKCEGVGNLMMYAVYYSKKYQYANYGILENALGFSVQKLVPQAVIPVVSSVSTSSIKLRW